MKKAILVLLILFGISIYSFGDFSKDEDKNRAVAVLDGENIYLSDIKEYCENVLGKKYKNFLDTTDGLKELTKYYISRQIILKYAEDEIENLEPLLNSHENSNLDRDTILIAAVLKKEVKDKVEITEEELKKYMANANAADEAAAFSKLQASKHSERLKEFIDSLKKNHKIELFL